MGALVISYRVLCRLLIFAFIFHVTCEKGTKISAYICEFRRQGASTGCLVLWPKVNTSEYMYIYILCTLYIYKFISLVHEHVPTKSTRSPNIIALSPSGCFPSSLPPSSLPLTWHSFRGIILCCRLIHIWRLVKYAQCLPFCRLCPCQRRHTALMPFKRNTTRITNHPHTPTHTYTQGYSIEMSSCKISYGQPCDICARCQLPLMAAHFAPA